MRVRDEDQLKLLHQQYLVEARKFVQALQDNAPPKELLSIRRNVRLLLQEIRSFIRSAGTSGQLWAKPGYVGISFSKSFQFQAHFFQQVYRYIVAVFIQSQFIEQLDLLQLGSWLCQVLQIAHKKIK